jgi:TatD DNase family protein
MPHGFHDAHNHLQDEALLPYRERLLQELPALGCDGMVVNGTNEEDWVEVAALASRADWIIPSFGLHPWDCGNAGPQWIDTLQSQLCANPRAVIGEIGLDRWILDRAKPDDPRLAGLRRAPIEEQMHCFLWQLALACELNRPVSIHCLDAWGPLLECMKKISLPKRGFLLHAYAGPPDMVQAFANMGAFFSFNGSFLDPRRKQAQAAFRLVPEERLLMETDAPAMPLPPPWAKHTLPLGREGTQLNHPGNIASVYEGFASLYAMNLEDLKAICARNFRTLFT